jgi:hypothetical protein
LELFHAPWRIDPNSIKLMYSCYKRRVPVFYFPFRSYVVHFQLPTNLIQLVGIKECDLSDTLFLVVDGRFSNRRIVAVFGD